MSVFIDTYLWWLPFGSVPEISAEELKQKMAKTRNKPQLLDVRTMPEWQSGAIRGSTIVPVHSLKNQTENLGFDKSKPVIIICHTASRSIGGVRLLRNAGYKDVCHVTGGMRSWEKLGYPTVKPKL